MPDEMEIGGYMMKQISQRPHATIALNIEDVSLRPLELEAE